MKNATHWLIFENGKKQSLNAELITAKGEPKKCDTTQSLLEYHERMYPALKGHIKIVPIKSKCK